jgi:hypothetical protein
MQYLIYFAVTAPLLLGWLYYEAAHGDGARAAARCCASDD